MQPMTFTVEQRRPDGRPIPGAKPITCHVEFVAPRQEDRKRYDDGCLRLCGLGHLVRP